MIEIVCPSCQARYRLPEGAVGDAGRKVSCSSCSHGWVAYPEAAEATADAPLTLGPEAMAEEETAGVGAAAGGAPPPPQAKAGGRSGHGGEMGSRPPVAPLAGQGKTYNPYAAYDADETQSGASPYADEEDRGMAAYEAFAREQDDDDEDDEEAGEFSAGPGAMRNDKLAEDRATQMEQIRAMLNELKETPATTIIPAEDDEDDDEAYREQQARPTAVERSLAEFEDEERDPLRAKLEEYGKPKKTGDVKVTRTKMLKKHAKKVRRRKMEDAKGSGTFTTGFLLVVMVMAILVSVYLLSDLIVEKVPEAEPAIRDYVATMDQFRLWAGEQVAAAQAKIQEIIDN